MSRYSHFTESDTEAERSMTCSKSEARVTESGCKPRQSGIRAPSRQATQVCTHFWLPAGGWGAGLVGEFGMDVYALLQLTG